MSAAVPLLPHSGHGHRAAVGFDPRSLRRITAMALRYRWRMLLAVTATALTAEALGALGQPDAGLQLLADLDQESVDEARAVLLEAPREGLPEVPAAARLQSQDTAQATPAMSSVPTSGSSTKTRSPSAACA